MIERHWTALAKPGMSEAYVRHLEKETFPKLKKIPGFVGGSILRRPVANMTEFVVVTLWEDVEAIREFAGPDIEKAVVPPKIAAMMAKYDENARHFDKIFKVDF